MSQTKRNLLLVLASGVLLSVLVLVFRPYDLLDDAHLGPRTTAHIISVERVATMSHQYENHIAKLSIRLGDGQTAVAAALERQVANCLIGDPITVRRLPSKNENTGFYRVVSKSCAKADW